MTPEERDELRADLEAAGCPMLSRLTTFYGAGTDAECAELRSLLRREVWVVQPPREHATTLGTAVFSRENDAIAYAAGSQRGTMIWPHTIDAEVPDEDG